MPDPSSDAGAPHAQSYEITPAGTVVDRVTGLTWQRDVDAKSYPWADAKAYCGCLKLGGYEDWRLPTRIELVSLVDFTRSSPAIDGNAFPSTPSEYFWTASLQAGDSQTAWYIYFADGNTHDMDATKSNRVRCVRGEAAPPAVRYRPGADGTVLDEATGLTWQRSFDATTHAWSDARSYCGGLSLAGGGWRLPNMKELQSLIDDTKVDPAIDVSAFPGTQGQAFWSGSPLSGALPDAWFVNFYAGVSYSTSQTNLYPVRCVR
jgi:formylglycine-generating enzyme required for sulfatase activity